MVAFNKIQTYITSTFASISQKDLKVLAVFYICHFLFIFFAQEFNFLIGFFSFFICALLLTQDQSFFLRPLTIVSLFHWPSFYILSTFFSVLKQGITPFNPIFLIGGFFGLILSLQVCIGLLATTYLQYRQNLQLNEALTTAFKSYIKNFIKSFLFFSPFAFALAFLGVQVEIGILFIYPWIFIFTRESEVIKK